MTRPANENPRLKGSPFYDTLYRDLDISLPADICTDPDRFIPKAMMDQGHGRRQPYSYNYDLATCREHHVRYYQTMQNLMQNVRLCLYPLTWLLAFAAGLHAPSAAAATPSIVVIYADDLGYGDVHCYNPDRGKIPTPHIDRLAAQGMRFTDAHSSSGVCSPSRYTLLTGRYHWRTPLQSGIVGTWGDPLIAPDRVTLGTLARQHGYRTACIGKWHLGWDWSLTPDERRSIQAVVQPKSVGVDAAGPTATAEQQAAWQRIFSRPIAGGPTSRGFDVYFGTDVPNWPPYCFIADDRTVGIPSEFLPAADLQDHRASVPGPALPD